MSLLHKDKNKISGFKICIRQAVNGNKDPVLHVTITNHPAYMAEAIVLSDVEDATIKITRWIKAKLNETNTGASLEDRKRPLYGRREGGDQKGSGG